MTMLAARDARGRLVSTWSAEEEATLRARFAEGATDREIAAEVGRPWASVRLRRYALGLKRGRAAIVMDENPGWQGAANGHRLYWTNERVDEALRTYARTHPGPLPRGTKQWDVITKGDLALPPSVRILQQYTALGNAWRALLPKAEVTRRLPLQWVRYTEAEDDYIAAHISTQSIAEIAAALGRTETSVRMHARRDLGLRQGDARDWWSPREVAEHYGCPVSRVRKLIDTGLLPARKTGRVMVDVRFLPGVGSDYDQRSAGSERIEAIRAALLARNARRPKPVAIRRHGRAGHNDVITRYVAPSRRRAS